MCRELQELNNNHGVVVSPTPNEPTISSSFDRISPVLLLVIVILAAIFFISGLIHLLIRYLTKRPSFSPVYNSNRFPDSLGSRSLRRQLQQLFRQHDSGLDQPSIEALPVFYYLDIIGLKEPFDCAVCLSEFRDRDKLRLIPVCGHAFHLDCIDTWLLSNSTCPLCRRSLLSSINTPHPVEIPLRFRPETLLNQSMTINEETETSSNGKTPVLTERDKRVFSVRLGKFRSSFNDGQGSSGAAQHEEANRYNIGRRCYSMGTVQYVVRDSNLLVALPSEGRRNLLAVESYIEKNEECSEGKKIKGRIRGDSFSVSKIWLWSKKNKIPNSSSNFDMNVSSFVDGASEIARHRSSLSAEFNGENLSYLQETMQEQ